MPLTGEENKSYKKQKAYYIDKKGFSTDYDTKNHHKVWDNCHYSGKYRGTAHSICNLRYKTPKEIPALYHNGSTYDYHFTIKELPKEFEGQFECLRKYREITFQYQSKKKTW